MAKGTVLIEMVKLLRSHPENASQLVPDAQRHYLEDRMMPAAWYPERDLLELIRAGVRLVGGHRTAVLDGMGKGAASAHFRDWYGHGKDPDPGDVMRRTSSLWSAQHNTGRHEFHARDTHSGHIEITGYGLPSEEMCRLTGAYSAEFLRKSGWGKVTVKEEQCVRAGAASCRWLHTWDRSVEAA